MYQAETIRTRDGWTIQLRVYKPATESRSVIVIAPSAIVTQDLYTDFALFFRQKGFTVLSYDYRGTGLSAASRKRADRAGLKQWAMQDTDAVLCYVRNQFRNKELIYVGHGIGGEIIGLAAASQFIDRLILINSGLSCNRLRRWTDMVRIGILKPFISSARWLGRFFPEKKRGLFNQVPRGVISDWVRWSCNTNGLFDEFSDHYYQKLRVPLLALSFTDDWRSREESVKALLEHFGSSDILQYHVDPSRLGRKKMGHPGFFKPSSQADLWLAVLQWMDEGTYELSARQSYKTK